MIESTELHGLRIYPFTSSDELLSFVANVKKILIAINAEKVIRAAANLRAIINDNIGYADGIGPVMALKRKGFKNAAKIPGCELWLRVIARYYRSKSFYLIGSTDAVINQTVQKLKRDCPSINIVNYRNGYIKDDEKPALLDDVRAKQPDIVFVAMGSPRQELLMRELLEVHPALYLGLGGSFDVYVNNVRRAPQWWTRHNLEWAYRLLKQPTRITRQIYCLRFMIIMYMNKL